MTLIPKLELKQSQSLVMTPQLMQAIKLLQLSNLDLIDFVEAELERNPLLERLDGDENEPAVGELSGPTGEGSVRAGQSDSEPATDGVLDRFDIDAPDLSSDDAGPAADDVAPSLLRENWNAVASRQPISSEAYDLEAFVAAERTLADHLLDQLRLSCSDASIRMIGSAIIDEIDEAGYLRTDLGSIAERLAAPPELVETALRLVQGFEPAGIGARDLAECLALQLAENNRLDPAMRTLLDNLDLVARHDYPALKRLCGIDDDDLVDMMSEIRGLNPKPGNAYSSAPVQPIIPDVLVRPSPDGGWLVELNSDTLPRVLVNKSYYTTVAKRSASDAEQDYLTDCLQTANWLVRSLDQRARTILKVATEIVRQQDGFLAHGVQHMRPLSLKMIAEAINMHESTVSRVTSNKYMATTRGIFELKYFFTAAIASAGDGDAHSAEAVRHRIRRLIEAESPDDVLSDDTIVRTLRASGVDIARRTVAKYRETMRIPSSVQRRREKRLAN